MSNEYANTLKPGERALLKSAGLLSHGELCEAKCLEVSPKGNVKLKWANSGHDQWVEGKDYIIVELLPKKFKKIITNGEANETVQP